MATVTAKKGTLIRSNEVCSSPEAATTFAASDTVKIPAEDKNLVLLIQPSATGNVVFKKGSGYAAVKDMTLAVTKDKDNFIELDTAAFGDDGYITMVPAVAGNLSLINAL